MHLRSGLRLLLLLKPAIHAKVGKNKVVYKLLPQPASPKTEENTTQGKNQRLPAPLNPFSVTVSNTVNGRSFHIRTWGGIKHVANWDVLHLDTSNSN